MLFNSYLRRKFSNALSYPSTIGQTVPGFINVSGNDGVKLHTALFPNKPTDGKFEKPKATIIYFHAYGSYIEKNAPVIAKFQEEGFEVVGFDMRCFGRSLGEPKGLIKDTSLLVRDSRNFLTTLN